MPSGTPHKTTAPKANTKRGRGRPTEYRREFVEQVRRLCSVLGATEFEIAQFLGVTEVTLWRWKHEHPEFCKALRVGKRAANKRVEERLYARSVGYSHEDVDIRVIDGAVVQTPIIKHYPPSEGAAKLFLTNRDPRRWRNLISTTVETPPGKPLEHAHTYGTPDVLRDYYARQRAAEEAAAAAVGSGVVSEAAVPEGDGDLGPGDEEGA